MTAVLPPRHPGADAAPPGGGEPALYSSEQYSSEQFSALPHPDCACCGQPLYARAARIHAASGSSRWALTGWCSRNGCTPGRARAGVWLWCYFAGGDADGRTEVLTRMPWLAGDPGTEVIRGPAVSLYRRTERFVITGGRRWRVWAHHGDPPR